jgi:hypothetical protein
MWHILLCITWQLNGKYFNVAHPAVHHVTIKWQAKTFFFLMARQPLGGLGLLIFEASRSYFLDTPHSVGLLWTSDQLVAETSLPDNTQHSQQTDIHAPGEIRTHNPSKPAAADPRLRPRGYWDRPRRSLPLLRDLLTSNCRLMMPNLSIIRQGK